MPDRDDISSKTLGIALKIYFLPRELISFIYKLLTMNPQHNGGVCLKYDTGNIASHQFPSVHKVIDEWTNAARAAEMWRRFLTAMPN